LGRLIPKKPNIFYLSNFILIDFLERLQSESGGLVNSAKNVLIKGSFLRVGWIFWRLSGDYLMIKIRLSIKWNHTLFFYPKKFWFSWRRTSKTSKRHRLWTRWDYYSEWYRFILFGGTVLVRKVPDDRWSFVTGAYLKSAVLPGTVAKIRCSLIRTSHLLNSEWDQVFLKSAITY
jgi:hypothetical protein